MAPTTAPPDADGRVGRLLAELSGHVPDGGREERSCAEVLDGLDTLRRPFDRHAATTHVTASAIVVGPRGVLLHRHRRLHRWLQPGGHLDPGEYPTDAALREGEEETGLALTHPRGGPVLVHVDVHEASEGHVHLDIQYLLCGPDADPAPPPDESQDVAWFGWAEAASVADAGLAGALRSARRLIDTGAVDVPGVTPEEIDG